MKKILAKAVRPLFSWWKKRNPDSFNRIQKEAGSLDLSAMLTEFNLLHRFFFRDTLGRIQIDKADIEKIRRAATQGPLVYMMRHWGQIEYNFFNALFLKEGLPLAAHANLIRMHWWMKARVWWAKLLARLNFFYEKGNFPEKTEEDPFGPALTDQKACFAFLNLPPELENTPPSEENLIRPLLTAAGNLEDTKRLQIIPLNFIYDRRPGKAEKSLVDILFGEKENPGSLRKTVLFFRNYKKRAVASVGDPLDVKEFLAEHADQSLSEQSAELQTKLHRIFFKEKKAITGPRLKSREKMIELVLQDKQLREKFMTLAPELKKPLDELYLKAQEILEEIVSDPNSTFIDVWYIVLDWVFKNIYDGLTVDEAGLSRVKQVATEHPLVLVPSHRSHVDYLLLSYIFYRYNLSLPLVAAGVNLSFWPMGYIFRRSGAFFLRRSFGSDKLYPLLFQSYIKVLLREGYFQEFFIEGSRSRTGKLERPRTGLLSLYLDCFLEGASEDIYFVPISINYEKVLEEGSYAREVKGAKKEKEHFWDLFRVGKYLRHRSGQVYVSFGEPISLKQYAERKGLGPEMDGEAKRGIVQRLARRIALEIEEVTVATAPALVAVGLLSSDQKGQGLKLLFERIELFKKALLLRNVPLSEPLQKNYAKALSMALSRYASQGFLEEHHDGLETFYTASDTGRIRLDYYKNSLMHNLVPLSLAALVFSWAPTALKEDEIETAYQELKDLFRHEFINILPYREALADLSTLGVIEQIQQGAWQVRSPTGIAAFALLMKNFLEAYKIALIGLQRMSFQKTEEKVLVQRWLELGQKLYLKGEITRPEALSQFTLQNALFCLKERGLVKTHEKELGKEGLKLYSSTDDKEKLEETLQLIEGKNLISESKAPIYLLKN